MAKKRVSNAKKKSAARTVPQAKAAIAVTKSATPAKTPGLAGLIRANLAVAPPVAKPLPAGTPGTEVPITAALFQQLISAAATQDNQGTVVWTIGGCELLVTTGKVAAQLDDGLVMINIPVSCDQAASATVQVPFAIGAKDSPAGMICATEDRPRGPAAVVDVWGDALIAFAWRLLLTVTAKVAAQSGTDEDGAGLIAAAMTASKSGLTLLPIARHTFDRVKS